MKRSVSKGYMVFLVILMGLVSQMDGWLSLIETKAVPGILTPFEYPPYLSSGNRAANRL